MSSGAEDSDLDDLLTVREEAVNDDELWAEPEVVERPAQPTPVDQSDLEPELEPESPLVLEEPEELEAEAEPLEPEQDEQANVEGPATENAELETTPVAQWRNMNAACNECGSPLAVHSTCQDGDVDSGDFVICTGCFQRGHVVIEEGEDHEVKHSISWHKSECTCQWCGVKMFLKKGEDNVVVPESLGHRKVAGQMQNAELRRVLQNRNRKGRWGRRAPIEKQSKQRSVAFEESLKPMSPEERRKRNKRHKLKGSAK